jgi:hypothetical protein
MSLKVRLSVDSIPSALTILLNQPLSSLGNNLAAIILSGFFAVARTGVLMGAIPKCSTALSNSVEKVACRS